MEEIDRCAVLLDVKPCTARPLMGVTLRGASGEHYSVDDLAKAFNDKIELINRIGIYFVGKKDWDAGLQGIRDGSWNRKS